MSDQSSANRERRRIDRSDLYVGLGAVIGGAVVIPYALSMPQSGGLPGPGLFPGLIGAFAVLFGVALIVKAFRGRPADDASVTATSLSDDAASLSDDAASPTGEVTSPDAAGEAPEETVGAMATSLAATQKARWLNAAVVLGAIVCYILLAEILGFLITMFVILAAIMLTLRARVVVALVTAAGLTGLLYAIFELGLLVQLPDGPLGV